MSLSSVTVQSVYIFLDNKDQNDEVSYMVRAMKNNVVDNINHRI